MKENGGRRKNYLYVERVNTCICSLMYAHGVECKRKVKYRRRRSCLEASVALSCLMYKESKKEMLTILRNRLYIDS